MSDEPIHDVCINPHNSERLVRGSIGIHPVVLPGDSVEAMCKPHLYEDENDMQFRDNSGRWWKRTLTGRKHSDRERSVLIMASGIAACDWWC